MSVFYSCSQNKSKSSYSFYHWKSKALMTPDLENKIGNNLNQVYLHYFDIDLPSKDDYYNFIKPKYVLREVDDWYKEKEIIPVVYITNRALLKTQNIESLANKIHLLVNEISTHHFGNNLKDLQIDCDWTKQSKTKYFQLLTLLKEHYNLSATIRLHQVKYPKETGIPPVDKGALMLYNIGKLSSMDENSILNTKTVQAYINNTSSYPLDLDLALPLFSQTVIKNRFGKVKLINHIPESLTDTNSFSLVKDNLYIPKKDTLYHGFFISPDYQLKTEFVSSQVLLESIQILKNSKLNLQSTIFYHLDEKHIENYNLSQITSAL